MTDLQLYNELSMLPANLKQEVEDFILFLKSKTQKTESFEPLKERQFGIAKGFFKMEKDFDDPLEDFKEYM